MDNEAANEATFEEPADAVDEELDAIWEEVKTSGKTMIEALDQNPDTEQLLCEQAVDGIASISTLFSKMAEDIESNDEVDDGDANELKQHQRNITQALRQLARILAIYRAEHQTVRSPDDET